MSFFFLVFYSVGSMEDQEVNLRDPRGLQQGDPLSLLLFTSVAHGLDRMVDDVV